MIAASRGTEFAWEEKGSGVFTAAMIEAIHMRTQGFPSYLVADANRDGFLSVSELRDYVSTRVPELTNGQQKPVVRAESAEFDFPVF